MSLKSLIITLSFSTAIYAFQFPFKLPWFPAETSDPAAFLPVTVEPEVVATGPQPLRIAVVGAGAGGSSAAFWISKAKERFGYDVEVDVFEKENYVGGRSSVIYPHGDKSLQPMELGASIYVRANRNLMRAAKEFELSLKSFRDEEDSNFGIFDGEEFLVSSTGKGFFKYWDNLKLFWRYGYKSPTRTQALTKEAVKSILTLYEPTKPYQSVEELSERLNFTSITAMTGAEYFDLEGVSKLFSRELIEAATRVNYAQNLDKMHALDALVSMAANGATGTKGGNYQIFEEFLKRSIANIHFNTTVSNWKEDASGKWNIKLTTPQGSSQATYDHLILAAPFPSNPPVEYVKLHVTLLTTTSPSILPSYFGLSEGSVIPTMILTTNEGFRHGGKAPEFNSVSYHPGNYTREDGEKEWAVKVFSEDEKSDEWLESLFGAGKVTWVYRKLYNAYPVLPPIEKYPAIKLDKGLWYLNGQEAWISTMETTTIGSRNAVDLLLTEAFGSGICGNWTEPIGDEKDEWGGIGADGKIWGWDC